MSGFQGCREGECPPPICKTMVYAWDTGRSEACRKPGVVLEADSRGILDWYCLEHSAIGGGDLLQETIQEGS